jgi:phosphonate transport system substrate-binding protein
MSLANNAIKICILSCVLAFIGCTKEAELGTRNNPIKLYFTPSVDSDTITTNSTEFVKFLEQETGYYFKTGIPTSFISVVEAFGSSRADIGVMNSFGYILANEKYGARALLKVIRYGHDYYQGAILAHADSGITSVKDLDGKRFAYTDAASTSGYMFPLKMMKDAGVSTGPVIFAGKHDSVVIAIYQKQVDAGAAYYSAPDEAGKVRDARARAVTQFPDVLEKVKLIDVTEKIPNDPFVFRKDLSPEITEKFIAAVKKYISTPEGKQSFQNIYSVEGILDTTDADYDGLREVIKAININPADHI